MVCEFSVAGPAALRRAARREEQELKLAAGEEIAKRGGKPRGPVGRTCWYARYRMWIEARKLDGPARQAMHGGGQVDILTDLTEEERRLCLQRVHDHFSKSHSLQLQRGGFIERQGS